MFFRLSNAVGRYIAEKENELAVHDVDRPRAE